MRSPAARLTLPFVALLIIALVSLSVVISVIDGAEHAGARAIAVALIAFGSSAVAVMLAVGLTGTHPPESPWRSSDPSAVVDAAPSASGDERMRLRSMLASTADGLFALDREGTVRYANPAAESFFGRSLGRQFLEVVRRHELAEIAEQARSGSRFTSAPVYLEPLDKWLQATVSPIAGGGEWASLVILRDVTDVRKAEITRRDFVANVSHELRTPLAGLKAVVETLRDGALDDRTAAEEFLVRADAEVDRLIHLVDELLQLARLEAGAQMAMSSIDLRQLLTSVVDRFSYQAARGGVKLTLDVQDRLAPVSVDAARISQAVGNLVHNAIKFTPMGGWVLVEGRQRGDETRIEVRDSGRGIDPLDVPRVFERFYVADRARSEGGTGLGLAIVKHVVLAHGGSVGAESTPGRGSAFWIVLPNPSLDT
ncbi:MAG: sensor histidine kinase [Dehalococcoidia bacterium]